MSRQPSPVRIPVSLRWLFPNSSFVGCADIRVTGATHRSDQCRPNALFAAIPGTQLNGANFAADAIRHGAGSLLTERPLVNVSVPQCIVPNVREAYARLCAELAGNPSRQLKLAAVTGTNGKTTVTWMIRSILQQAHLQTGLLGTIEYSNGVDSIPASLTTPDSQTLSNRLEEMVFRNSTHAAIEISSHALDQNRSAGTELDVAVVTNVTQDHFDYHTDYENYLASKSRIAHHLKQDGLLILNADDPGSRSLQKRYAGNSAFTVTTFGLVSGGEATAEILEETLEGTRFVLHLHGESVEIATSQPGRHNVENCLAAAVAADRFGIAAEDIKAGIEALQRVPGRLERIDCGQPFDVFVDYAHTDDALKRCITALKQLTAGRVICVFGAGGDRDRSKRPLLAKAGAQADLPVVTSDNPRTESPQGIIKDILAGFQSTSKRPYVEADRAAAIRWAIEHAGPKDCLLIAGKGHETEQIIGTTRMPFDDREVVRSVLQEFYSPAQSGRERIGA